MRLLLCFLVAVLARWPAIAAPVLELVAGSVSPDGKLALAIAPREDPADFEQDSEVFLVEPRSKRVLAVVPECYSHGGSWGERRTNVRAAWHSRGGYLIVNVRTGRLMGAGLLFKVTGTRLTQIELPSRTSHPKSKVLDVLTFTANPGANLSWGKDGSLVWSEWGYMPKDGHFSADYSKYGLEGLDQVIDFVYRFDHDGRLRLVDLRVPSPETL